MLNFLQKKPDVFWSWFAEHEQRLRRDFMSFRSNAVEDDSSDQDSLIPLADKMIAGFSNALNKFDRRIQLYGGLAEDGVTELIFTAEGRQSVFPRIFELVASAPNVPGWRFVPLKPAHKTVSGTLHVKGVSLDIASLSYAIYDDEMDDERPVLILLTDVDVSAAPDTYQFLAHLAAEAHLGEYTYATCLDDVTIAQRAAVEPHLLKHFSPICQLRDDFPVGLPN